MDTDLYVCMEIAGVFYFLPDYLEEALPLVSATFPADLALTDILLAQIYFPPIPLPSMTGIWHGAAVRMSTVITMDYDFVAFSLEGSAR